jgi:hypothetical protein
METVIFKTPNAIFEFSQKDVLEHLSPLITEHNGERLTELLELIETSGKEKIVIPERHNYFALDLIATRKGSTTCKVCAKIFRANELESFVVGHGRSPFDINLKMKGGVKNLFRKKQKMPAMFGGKGYQCPEGHELISMITWRT